MSNVWKSAPFSKTEKRHLQHKPISFAEVQESSFEEANIETEADRLEDFRRIEQEHVRKVEQLQEEAERLRLQMEQEKETTQADIQNWWIQKQEEARQIAQEARQKGYQEGYAAGQEQAEQNYAQRFQQLQQTIERAYEEKDRIIHSAEPFLLELSVQMAKKIIGEELKQDSSQLLSIIQQGLKQVQETDDITIQVATAHYSQVLAFIEELEEQYSRANLKLKVIPDHTHQEAGCLIHTPHGTYDVKLDSQLSEIRKELLAHVEGGSADVLESE